MRSTFAFAAQIVRSRLRARGTGVLLLVCVAAALGVAAAPASSGAEASAVVYEVLVVALVAAAVAAGSGGVLPADRVSGREPWLRSLRPPPASRRVGAAAAGTALAIAAGVLGGGVAAAALRACGRDVPTREVEPLRVEGGPGTRAVVVPAGPDGRTLEVDVVPVFRDLAAAGEADVAVCILRDGVCAIEARVPVRGTARLVVDGAGGRLRPGSLDRRVDVVVTGARFLGEERSFPGNVALAGLLLGLCAACAVPATVLVSRVASGPTAAAAGALLLLVGALRADLRSLASDVVLAGGSPLPAGVLRVATGLAPDLSSAAAVGDVARGRALPAAAFAGLMPAFAHAAVCTLLLAVPGPRGRRR